MSTPSPPPSLTATIGPPHSRTLNPDLVDTVLRHPPPPCWLRRGEPDGMIQNLHPMPQPGESMRACCEEYTRWCAANAVEIWRGLVGLREERRGVEWMQMWGGVEGEEGEGHEPEGDGEEEEGGEEGEGHGEEGGEEEHEGDAGEGEGEWGAWEQADQGAEAAAGLETWGGWQGNGMPDESWLLQSPWERHRHI